MTNYLFTIGYEGSDVSSLVTALQDVNVDTLIDIRELPISRKAGFSKKALGAVLESLGISYVHLRGLGDPKPGREAARAGEFAEFRSIYRRHLKRKAAQSDLAVAIKLAKLGRSCLLCFERDSANCHRAIVAAEISKTIRVRVSHLIIEPTGRILRKSYRSRQPSEFAAFG